MICLGLCLSYGDRNSNDNGDANTFVCLYSYELRIRQSIIFIIVAMTIIRVIRVITLFYRCCYVTRTGMGTDMSMVKRMGYGYECGYGYGVIRSRITICLMMITS